MRFTYKRFREKPLPVATGGTVVLAGGSGTVFPQGTAADNLEAPHERAGGLPGRRRDAKT